MKIYKLILKLSAVDNEIFTIQEQISLVENLPYYKNFNQETERQFDLTQLKLKLKDLISTKLAILDNFSSAAELEKAVVSGLLKTINLSGNEIQKIN